MNRSKHFGGAERGPEEGLGTRIGGMNARTRGSLYAICMATAWLPLSIALVLVWVPEGCSISMGMCHIPQGDFARMVMVVYGLPAVASIGYAIRIRGAIAWSAAFVEGAVIGGFLIQLRLGEAGYGLVGMLVLTTAALGAGIATMIAPPVGRAGAAISVAVAITVGIWLWPVFDGRPNGSDFVAFIVFSAITLGAASTGAILGLAVRRRTRNELAEPGFDDDLGEVPAVAE